ncbi:ABC transporter permease [Streptomyces johnsoniae]|uniref:ABC transporter permease n=1 Tax=Streptomyces johnsoniae TaxID=3075532 RepID=A0ABU2RYE7_9ACTN|nr:ABC transporter permease [Streptomyces sp. DSM 41886]MDT0441763.1 ABC transporter permease [Streptomyces sp. DSM 41886]
MSAPPTDPKSPPASARSARVVLIIVLAIPVFVAFALWAFSWPVARMAPNELPVGVAGPEAAAGPVAEQLRAQDGSFDVHVYEDEAQARAAIEDREVYGAFVLSPEAPPQMLTATAGSPAVAQLLSQLAAQQAPEGTEVAVVDVVPGPPGDPRGAAFNTSVMPLGLAGMATGAAVGFAGLRRGHALVALVGAAALVGAVGALIGHSWLEALDGSWLAVASVLGLMVLTGASLVAGCVSLLGPPGVGVGALFLVLLGTPWSGAASAPEMLPDPIGVIGQLLPTGSGVTMLRSVSGFDGAAIGFPLTVLLVWIALGLTGVLLGRRPGPGARPAPVPVPDDDQQVPAAARS